MKKPAAIMTVIVMLSNIFCYEKKVTSTVEYSAGAWNESRTEFVFLRWERDFHMPKGIAKFPDGGVPKYVRDDKSICVYSKKSGEVKVIAEGRGVPRGYPPSARFSWKGDYAVYKIWNADPAENRGNPVVLINMKTLEQREFYDLGEMPELSPGGLMIATVKVNTVRIIKTDGSGARDVFKRDVPEIVFVMWREEAELELYVKEKAKFAVYNLSLITGDLKKSDKPYLKEFGNESAGDVLKEKIRL